MATAQSQFNLAWVLSYFAENLALGDYYAVGQEAAGEWFTAGSRQFEMTGPVKSRGFLNLPENPPASRPAPLMQGITAPDGQPVIRGIDVTPIQDSDETPTP